jgi:threonine dehydratase
MLTVEDIEKAEQRIAGSIYESPLVYSESLSSLSGNSIYLKLENLQITGSFKERGALNRILTLTETEARAGVIAASAGNHGQAVAYHACRRGIAAEIWMPRQTPLIKRTATEGYGATVVLHGESYDEAYDGARASSAERNATFIHAFDDDDVIAGQGTIGFEVLRQNPDLDLMVVPLGGGGLIAGVACAIKARNSRMQVVGVQTSRLPSMQKALDCGEPLSLPAQSTLADGIAVRRAGERTLALVKKFVDGIVTVDEEDIAEAILTLLEREKTLAEGAGAVALAAMLQKKIACEGKTVAVLISGGNLDVSLLSRIIERGLLRDGRRLRLRVWLPDYPGALEGLAAAIARTSANIVETLYNRSHYGVSLGETAIDVTVETRGREHVTELMGALDRAKYKFSVIE